MVVSVQTIEKRRSGTPQPEGLKKMSLYGLTRRADPSRSLARNRTAAFG